jgi:hypothetical protein
MSDEIESVSFEECLGKRFTSQGLNSTSQDWTRPIYPVVVFSQDHMKLILFCNSMPLTPNLFIATVPQLMQRCISDGRPVGRLNNTLPPLPLISYQNQY